MPRIRTLKPEHKQHRKIGRLDDRTYRLWVGMITEADDEGRVVAEPAQLRVLIFGYHPEVTEEDVEDSLSTLGGLRVLSLYTHGGVRYATFEPSWRDHQKISKPTRSKLPPCPSFPEGSSSTPGAVQEDSRRTPHGSDLIGSDQGSRKGSEGRGVRGEGAGDGSPAPPLSHAAPKGNGSSPDGWPLNPAERKQAMLDALKIKMREPQPEPPPF